VTTIALVAGETSGDKLGASLIHALRERMPHAKFVGVGGSHMRAAGCECLYGYDDLSVIGLVEGLKALPKVWRLKRRLMRYFKQNKPDIFVGIDATEFNISLELSLKKLGVKTVHYKSPSIWAWRPKRIHKIKRAVDLMLTLFPFEVELYHRVGMDAQCVGHPLADKVPDNINKETARLALKLDPNKPVLGLLPGSRSQEVTKLIAPFLAAAKRCCDAIPDLQCVVPAATPERRVEIDEALSACGLEVKCVDERSTHVMAAADVILVASGTATLEAAFMKCPMVVAYKLSSLSFHILKYLVKTPYVALPNILAGRQLVPELIQDAATPEAMAAHVLDYFNDEAKRDALIVELSKIHQDLKRDASEIAARAIVNCMSENNKHHDTTATYCGDR